MDTIAESICHIRSYTSLNNNNEVFFYIQYNNLLRSFFEDYYLD
jgi:hypothetical protein